MLITGDEFDFEFSPTTASADGLNIGRGRAILGINEAGCTTYCAYSSFVIPDSADAAVTSWAFNVKDSAVSLVSGLAGGMAATALLFAF